MLAILNLLEPYNLQQSHCLDSHLNTHRFIEALKFGFGARSEICDPRFAQNASRFDEFYTKEWADSIRPLITDVGRTRFIPRYRADVAEFNA